MTRKKGELPHCGHRDRTKKTTTDHPPRKIRRILRVVAYNALFTFAGLTLIAIAGEIYLRLTTPFISSHYPRQFVRGVGFTNKPNTEMRYTNGSDFWTIWRTNSLGFADREPIGSERAAESCHIALIGDSFVQAKEVPIADKFHVRLEELAARHLPHLDITTSAYGLGSTGQIHQLPFYDEFARRLSPDLVVLVFVDNDFLDNSPIQTALWWSVDRDRQPFATAKKNEDGTMELRLPYPPVPRDQAPLLTQFHYGRIVNSLKSRSGCVRWLHDNISTLFSSGSDFEMSAQRRHSIDESLLSFTAFGLDQFIERAERDGASLVILATHTMHTRGHPIFDHLNALAEARGIPVINQLDYIRRRGGEMRDAHWARDGHWNAQGHQWAAEALLEYLEENPGVCARPTTQ